jgi:hypothetical protein
MKSLALFINNLDAVFIAAPFIVLFLLKYILKLFMRNKRQSSKIATEISAIFFFIAVCVEINLFLDYQALWYMLLGLIFLFSILAMVSYFNHYEVSYGKLMRLFLRICFIIFALGYLGLLGFELFQRAQNV